MKKIFLTLVMMLTTSIIVISCTTESVAGEGSEGPENGESGIQWNIDQTADETANGLRLILTYNPTTSTFEGTLENVSPSVITMTRVEVHVIDATNNFIEFGPTPPTDMQPGATRNISLQITPGLNFVRFTIDAETGLPGSGS